MQLAKFASCIKTSQAEQTLKEKNVISRNLNSGQNKMVSSYNPFVSDYRRMQLMKFASSVKTSRAAAETFD